MQKSLKLILALTAADAVCTVAGLRLGAITEGNPLLAAPMTVAPELTAAAVCAAVAGLTAWLYSVRGRAPWLGTALAFVAGIKLWVMALHFRWIAEVLLYAL